jgi:hypothetical protein
VTKSPWRITPPAGAPPAPSRRPCAQDIHARRALAPPGPGLAVALRAFRKSRCVAQGTARGHRSAQRQPKSAAASQSTARASTPYGHRICPWPGIGGRPGTAALARQRASPSRLTRCLPIVRSRRLLPASCHDRFQRGRRRVAATCELAPYAMNSSSSRLNASGCSRLGCCDAFAITSSRASGASRAMWFGDRLYVDGVAVRRR